MFRFIIGKGTRNFNIVNMIENVVIAQFSAKKYNIAVVLAIFVDSFNIS